MRLIRLLISVVTFTVVAILAGMVIGCGWIPSPNPPEPPPVEPPYTEECQVLLDGGLPWCHEADMTCGECVHNPTSDPRACEKAPECPEEPPVEPPPTEPPPTTGECLRFPQGVPDDDFQGGATTSVLGTQVNAAIERVTRCPVGTDCLAGEAEAFYAAVTEELRSTGLWAGRHDDEPPGASDEIAVATSCEGWWESYHIYNFGGGKVVWSPGAARPAYKIDPKWCPTDCGTQPEPEQCPLPHPDMSRMKFTSKEYGGWLDTTLITVGQPEYCASIGYCCMPNTGVDNQCGSPGCIPRGGCPVRGDGHPDRAKCEAELCDQKWECNGQPSEGRNGNPAQTSCQGHYKTWCANAPNVVAEGDR